MKEKSDDRKNKKRRTTTGGEVSWGNLQQKHYLDRAIGGMTRNTGIVWTEIGESRRRQDPWKEED